MILAVVDFCLLIMTAKRFFFLFSFKHKFAVIILSLLVFSLETKKHVINEKQKKKHKPI